MQRDNDLQAPWVGLTPEQWDKKCGISHEEDDEEDSDNEDGQRDMSGDYEITELFVHDKDLPKVCAVCHCYDAENYCCDVTYERPWDYDKEKLEDCPLKSIEKHDEELKERYSKAMKEFAEQCNEMQSHKVLKEKIKRALEPILQDLYNNVTDRNARHAIFEHAEKYDIGLRTDE